MLKLTGNSETQCHGVALLNDASVGEYTAGIGVWTYNIWLGVKPPKPLSGARCGALFRRPLRKSSFWRNKDLFHSTCDTNTIYNPSGHKEDSASQTSGRRVFFRHTLSFSPSVVGPLWGNLITWFLFKNEQIRTHSAYSRARRCMTKCMIIIYVIGKEDHNTNMLNTPCMPYAITTLQA